MDSFAEIEPVAYSEFRERMHNLDIVECGDGSDGAKIFHQMKMGVSRARFYPVAYRGDHEMVFPPTIQAVLEYFGFDAADWQNAVNPPQAQDGLPG